MYMLNDSMIMARETDAMWVEGIYNFIKHVFEIKWYPVFLDKNGVRNVLDYPLIKKRFPCFLMHVSEVNDEFFSYFEDGTTETIRGNILKTSLKEGTFTIIHSEDSFEVYLNNEETRIIVGDRNVSNRETNCFISSTRYAQPVRIRYSDDDDAVYAVAE